MPIITKRQFKQIQSNNNISRVESNIKYIVGSNIWICLNTYMFAMLKDVRAGPLTSYHRPKQLDSQC